MSSYLDKFRSTLPKTQGNQILALLDQEKKSGQIKSVDEYKTRLSELTTELLGTIIRPSLKVFEAKVGKTIGIETFNYMLDRIRADLVTAFTESTAISELLTTHTNLINDVVSKVLSIMLDELEAKVATYEFMVGDSRGFDNAQFNTFKESKTGSTSRSSPNAALVYVDLSAREAIPPSEDASIDLIGQRLTLGPDSDKQRTVSKVRQIFDNEAPQAELATELDPDRSDLANILDNTNGTYWLYSVFTSDEFSNENLTIENLKYGVNTKLEFTFNGVVDLNYLYIKPASFFPMTLERIEYFDNSHLLQTLSSESVSLASATTVFLPTVSTNRIILTFNQKNSSEVEFELKSGRDLSVLRTQSISPNLADIDTELRTVFSSPFLLTDVIGLSAEAESLEQVRYHEYQVGFDNINFGLASFDSRGVFVGVEQKLDTVVQAALKVVESRPYQASGSDDVSYTGETYGQSSTDPPTLSATTDLDNTFLASIEYSLMKQDFNSAGAILATNSIPILPLGAEVIFHERLLLIESPVSSVYTTGQLRFYSNLPAVPGSKTTTSNWQAETSIYRDLIRVYRNGTEIPNKDEFETTDSGWYLAERINSPGTGDPMRIKIQIEDPSVTDIYTVSYVPKTSNTFTIPKDDNGDLIIIDMSGDKNIRMCAENIITFSPTINSKKIAYSKLYLIIVLRRDSGFNDITPAVEEYMLLTTSKIADKFEGV